MSPPGGGEVAADDHGIVGHGHRREVLLPRLESPRPPQIVLDVGGVEPMTSVVAAKLPMRDDEVTDGSIQDQVLANAPKTDEGFFVVPKAIE